MNPKPKSRFEQKINMDKYWMPMNFGVCWFLKSCTSFEKLAVKRHENISLTSVS